MSKSLNHLCWSLPRLSEAIEELALSTGLLDKRLNTLIHSAPLFQSSAVGPVVEATAEWMGLEADPLSVDYAEIEEVLRLAGPLVIRLPEENSSKFLAVARGSKHHIYVIA